MGFFSFFLKDKKEVLDKGLSKSKESVLGKITRAIEGAEELMIIGGGHSSSFDFTDTIINPRLLEFYGVAE